MKIICCFGLGEQTYSGAKSIVRALRWLGHDVLTCGPSYSYMGSDDIADLPVPDKSFPEEYTYREVLGLAPEGYSTILQLSPHFSLIGEKPKGIKSAYWIFDAHTGAAAWWRMAKNGSFDWIFCAQPGYMSCFREFSPIKMCFGFDEERLNPDLETEPRCDIAFSGEHGLSMMEYPHEDDIGRYAIDVPRDLPTDHTRFKFWQHGGYDYAPRGEMLRYFCKMYDVRIYERADDGEKYQRILQAGRVAWNHSLLGDFTYRVMEAAACGRVPICDKVLGQSQMMPEIPEYPRLLFSPLFENFQFQVKEAALVIDRFLKNEPRRSELAESLKNHTWRYNRWIDRVARVVRILES